MATDSQPTTRQAITWVLIGGALGGSLGIVSLLIARQIEQTGLIFNTIVSLGCMLLAGLVCGPKQRSQYGGSAAATIAFAALLAASYSVNLPIDMQRLIPFQVNAIIGLGFVFAIMLGAAGASPWTKETNTRQK